MPRSTKRKSTQKLQLTTKGKLVLTGLVLALVITCTLVALSRPTVPPAMAADGLQSETYHRITVQPGETLWDISSRISQGADPGTVLEHIVAYNDLESSELQVGQSLFVPADN